MRVAGDGGGAGPGTGDGEVEVFGDVGFEATPWLVDGCA